VRVGIFEHCHLRLHRTQQILVYLPLLLDNLLNPPIVVMLHQLLVPPGLLLQLLRFQQHPLPLLQFGSSPISHVPLPVHAAGVVLALGLELLQVVEVARFLGLLDWIHGG